jgi:hypothetical protein
VGTGPSDERLAELTVRESESVPRWMLDHGALFQRPLAGTLHLGRTNTFFLGGGKALMNNYHRTLRARGIPVAYEATVERIEFDGDRCTRLVVAHGGARHAVQAGAVVAAAGGFEANIDWLARYWGEAARNYHIRGPRHNDGMMLRELLDPVASTAAITMYNAAVPDDATAGLLLGFVLVTIVLVALSLGTTGGAVFGGPEVGSPYELVPHGIMVTAVIVPTVWTMGVMAVALYRYWRDCHGSFRDLLDRVVLIRLKRRADATQTTPTMKAADHGLLWALLGIMVSGLAVTFLRTTLAFGPLLVLHLAAVIVAFTVAPYTKFFHWTYRVLAIYKDNVDRPRATKLTA